MILDQSLDDLIKTQREQKKKMKGKNTPTKGTKIPKKTAGGVKSRAAIRTERTVKAGKPNSPYATPAKVKKEAALFTASYQAAKAPIKEIFTAGYIPKPSTNLKLVTVNRKVGLTTGRKPQQSASGPLTSKPMRLVTTQQIKREGLTSSSAAARSAAAASANRPDERIPTGPRIPESLAHASGNRGGDHGIPTGPASSGGRQADRNPTHQYPGDHRGGNAHHETRPGNINSRISIPRNSSINSNTSGQNTHNSSNNNNNIHHNNPANNNAVNYNTASTVKRQGVNPRALEPVARQDSRAAARAPAATSSSMSMDVDMEGDNTSIAIKGSAPGQQSIAFRGESGPVTIEIENLDPGTTIEDVKYVCSRFGEIKSCACANGFAQVTYARKAAGQAAIDQLHGKKADNNQILRVTMRADAILHDELPTNANRVPSSIAGPMKILQKAVHGTLRNAGNLYSDNILAAERVLREQQQRMQQLHDEEQRMAMIRSHNAQLSGLSSLSSNANRGFF